MLRANSRYLEQIYRYSISLHSTDRTQTHDTTAYHFLLLSLGGEICRHGTAVSAAGAVFRQRGGGGAVAARHQDDDVSDIGDVRYGAKGMIHHDLLEIRVEDKDSLCRNEQFHIRARLRFALRSLYSSNRLLGLGRREKAG